MIGERRKGRRRESKEEENRRRTRGDSEEEQRGDSREAQNNWILFRKISRGPKMNFARKKYFGAHLKNYASVPVRYLCAHRSPSVFGRSGACRGIADVDKPHLTSGNSFTRREMMPNWPS